MGAISGRYSPTVAKELPSSQSFLADNENSLSADDEVVKSFQKYGKDIDPYSTGRSSADLLKSETRQRSSTMPHHSLNPAYAKFRDSDHGRQSDRTDPDTRESHGHAHKIADIDSIIDGDKSRDSHS